MKRYILAVLMVVALCSTFAAAVPVSFTNQDDTGAYTALETDVNYNGDGLGSFVVGYEHTWHDINFNDFNIRLDGHLGTDMAWFVPFSWNVGGAAGGGNDKVWFDLGIDAYFWPWSEPFNVIPYFRVDLRPGGSNGAATFFFNFTYEITYDKVGQNWRATAIPLPVIGFYVHW